ncbi:hypothetical protein GX51_02894 [Blastomyces parvus]|uniref:Uncharacterized protein n=1 Tax=Blastomyces parvus TaxID=2060905 RepID=A0A2B7X9B2_9EURO|nr:hypothetical protein GX51_02894 [Blastomyces parvus]
MPDELLAPKTDQLEVQEEMFYTVDCWMPTLEGIQILISQVMDTSTKAFEAAQLREAAMQDVAREAENTQDPGLLRQVEKEKQERDILYREIEKTQDLGKKMRELLEVTGTTESLQETGTARVRKENNQVERMALVNGEKEDPEEVKRGIEIEL